MPRSRRSAFTLIELLVVIAVIAIIAAILFPIFAMAREKARMSVCLSNMRQIGSTLMLYAQDYDETFPCIRFHCLSEERQCYIWRNSIRPYLKNLDVLGCPSNPYSKTNPGQPPAPPPNNPGDNAEGWELEPEQRMPISYNMNSCAATWIPADDKRTTPPLTMSRLVQPANTIMIGETQWSAADIHPAVLWDLCFVPFAHSAGNVGNFIFYDGHVKSKKWLATVYPLTENNWELSPSSDPINLRIKGPPGCGGDPSGQVVVPPGPAAPAFQTKDCHAYQ